MSTQLGGKERTVRRASPAGDKEWDKAPSFGRGPKKAFRLTKLFSLTEDVLRDHLLGKQTIGVYPLLQDDTCWLS
jgi:hypothetical protein